MYFRNLILVFFLFTSFFSYSSEEESNSAMPELTEAEERILREGEISTFRYVSGGTLGTVIGFGSGHTVIGKYQEKGWIFTVGELASWAAYALGEAGYSGSGVTEFFSGRSQPDNSGTALIVLGYLGFLGFRIVEIVDIWSRPYDHNKNYREIKEKVSGQKVDTDEVKARSTLLVVPLISGKGPGVGLYYTF